MIKGTLNNQRLSYALALSKDGNEVLGHVELSH